MASLYEHTHGGASERGLLDFSVNITPQPPPIGPVVLDTGELVRYPAIDGAAVRRFYMERFGLEGSCVVAMNGAVEGIYLVPRALAVRKALLLLPSFFEYGRALRLAGAVVAERRLEEADGFSAPSGEALGRMLEESGADALFIGNPNNPTGTLFSGEALLDVARRHRDRYFIVDEAFIQYTEGFPANSLMAHVAVHPNIVVIHSLTKFYALPGLRLGAVVAHPEVVGRVLEHKEPWTVNAAAEQVAGRLMSFGAWEEEVRAMIGSERERIRRAVMEMGGYRLAGGAANFFLARWQGGSLDGLMERLHGCGLHVRDCRNFSGLEGEWFRFAIRTPEENGRLLRVLGEAAC